MYASGFHEFGIFGQPLAMHKERPEHPSHHAYLQKRRPGVPNVHVRHQSKACLVRQTLQCYKLAVQAAMMLGADGLGD